MHFFSNSNQPLPCWDVTQHSCFFAPLPTPQLTYRLLGWLPPPEANAKANAFFCGGMIATNVIANHEIGPGLSNWMSKWFDFKQKMGMKPFGC